MGSLLKALNANKNTEVGANAITASLATSSLTFSTGIVIRSDEENAMVVLFILKLSLCSSRAVRNMIFCNLRNTLHISVIDFSIMKCARGGKNLTCTILRSTRLRITDWIHADTRGIIRGPSKLSPLASRSRINIGASATCS